MKFTEIIRLASPIIVRELKAKEKDKAAAGWNPDIGWTSLATARTAGKPSMLLIHKPECPRCRRFKAELVKHSGVLKLAPQFSMVHLQPYELPGDEDRISEDTFAPDGRYVPRILFFDKNFKLLRDVKGIHEDFQYTYTSVNNVEINMNWVLQLTKNR